MKKIILVLFSMVFGLISFCMFAGCNTYKVPENQCIVGLSKEYQLYSDSEGKLCEPIDKRIKGIEKDDNTNYFSVVKNVNYTVWVDNFVDSSEGFGAGINGSISSAWWQGNVITGFAKTYSNESGLQDEVFFTTNYKQLYGNITVSFSENCLLKSIVEPYLYVGSIYEILEKGTTLSNSNIDNFIDENGIMAEMDGFYYLLLKDEVCVHQDAWKTNLQVINYSYEYLDDGWGKPIQVQFTAKPFDVSDNEESALYIICRTASGKYFVYPTVYVDAQGFEMPIREHELKLTFTF